MACGSCNLKYLVSCLAFPSFPQNWYNKWDFVAKTNQNAALFIWEKQWPICGSVGWFDLDRKDRWVLDMLVGSLSESPQSKACLLCHQGISEEQGTARFDWCPLLWGGIEGGMHNHVCRYEFLETCSVFFFLVTQIFSGRCSHVLFLLKLVKDAGVVQIIGGQTLAV